MMFPENRTDPTIECILEAAQIISGHPADLSVLKEQKRIFNEYVNVLIDRSKEEPK